MKTRKQKIEELKKDIYFAFGMLDLNAPRDELDELTKIIATYLVARGYQNCEGKKVVSCKKYYNLRQELCAPILTEIIEDLEEQKEFYRACENSNECGWCKGGLILSAQRTIKSIAKLNQVYLEEKDVTNDDN